MQSVYVSPQNPPETEGSYIPLDRKNGEAWQQDLAEVQDAAIIQNVNDAHGAAPNINMGYWEFTTNLRYGDIPAFLVASTLMKSVGPQWTIGVYSQMRGVNVVRHAGPAVSAHEDLNAYRDRDTTGASQELWEAAIGARDHFRQENKEIFNIYQHCYTLHILLSGMKEVLSRHEVLQKEERERWEKAALQYVKHPLGIAYFLTFAAGIVAMEYLIIEQMLTDPMFVGTEAVVGGVLITVLIPLLTGGFCAILYCGGVDMLLFNERMAAVQEIRQLYNGLQAAQADFRWFLDKDRIIAVGESNIGLYAQVASLYMRMYSTVALLVSPERNLDAIVNTSKETVESIAKVIDAKLVEFGYALPGREVV